MRAANRALVAVALFALATACSRQDRTQMSQDARDAAHSAGAEASKVAHDADMQRTEADLKRLGHETAQDIRKGAAEAKGATNAVVSDARRGAHQAGERQDETDRERPSS